MGFYKTIADYYDYIFPYNEQQLKFVKTISGNSNQNKILEVGCATGNLTTALGNISESAIGIDLDESLLSIAKSKTSDIDFRKTNMLEIGSTFKNEKFDSIICFGNTLVHLDNLEQIEEFISAVADLLTDEGTLYIQTINYDRIINQNINELPTIDNDKIKFVRNYKYLEEINKIEFSTELHIKESGDILTDSQHLFPLLQSEIARILEKHFGEINFYGSFKGDNFKIKKSQPLIITANKNATTAGLIAGGALI